MGEQRKHRGHAIYVYEVEYKLKRIEPEPGYRGNKDGSYTDKLIKEFPRLVKKADKEAPHL